MVANFPFFPALTAISAGIASLLPAHAHDPIGKKFCSLAYYRFIW